VSRSSGRVQLTPGYILHHRPYRDTSRILEVLTREHGRLTLFARAVRGPRARLSAVLQLFQPLLLSWSGRGEAPQLTDAERVGAAHGMPGSCLMPCFYLNELLLKLTTRHDPHASLFDAYHAALEELKNGAPLERTLRLFEKRLLAEVGYGLELEADSHTGRGIDPEGYYDFRPDQGLAPVAAGAPHALSGQSLLSLAREQLSSAPELEDARRLLQAALAHCLEGRELSTRAVARRCRGLSRESR